MLNIVIEEAEYFKMFIASKWEYIVTSILINILLMCETVIVIELKNAIVKVPFINIANCTMIIAINSTQVKMEFIRRINNIPIKSEIRFQIYELIDKYKNVLTI